MPEYREEEIRDTMTGKDPHLARQRRWLGRIPSSPRCKLCSAPFGGVGGMVLRPFGFGRYAGNPAMCAKCIIAMRDIGITGVEIPVSLVFSDIRGSTAMGEKMTPAQFHEVLHHFYDLATEAILDHNGLVDKIVGDEVIGLFFGGVSGPEHSARAVEAGLEIADRAAQPDATPMGPIPVGTAVHCGEALVGPTGRAGVVDDFTAIGDVVNSAARLASAAAAGEVLVSTVTTEAAGTDVDGLDRRCLPIRGREATIDVVVLRRADAA
jgi:adenylate cyclase